MEYHLTDIIAKLNSNDESLASIIDLITPRSIQAENAKLLEQL